MLFDVLAFYLLLLLSGVLFKICSLIMGRDMRRSIFRFTACLAIAGCTLSIWPGAAGAQGGRDGNEDEVILHTPFGGIDDAKRSGGGNAEGALSDSLDDFANYDDMVKYLDEQRGYLDKLNDKFKTFDEGADSSNNSAGDDALESGLAEREPDVMDEDEDDGNAGGEGKPASATDIADGQSGGLTEEAADDFLDDVDVDYGKPFEAAEVFYGMGRYKKALELYKTLKADSINEDDYVWAQFQIGNCKRNMGQFDKAIEEYQGFINKYTDSFWVDQVEWYIEDARWWKQWNSKISGGGGK